MAHGNKRYFFEELKQAGDTTLCKPNIGVPRVNIYSLKNQVKLYLKENSLNFAVGYEEKNNGSIIVTRTS